MASNNNLFIIGGTEYENYECGTIAQHNLYAVRCDRIKTFLDEETSREEFFGECECKKEEDND